MPSIERWDDVDALWSTMLHEACHWSGMPGRLERESVVNMATGKGRDKKLYAFEELIAELGAVFGLSALGRTATVRDDHLKYLSAWLDILREDPKALWRAASQAERAAGYLMAQHTAGLEARTAIQSINDLPIHQLEGATTP